MHKNSTWLFRWRVLWKFSLKEKLQEKLTFFHFPLLPFVANFHRAHGQNDGGDEEEDTAHHARCDRSRSLHVQVVVCFGQRFKAMRIHSIERAWSPHAYGQSCTRWCRWPSLGQEWRRPAREWRTWRMFSALWLQTERRERKHSKCIRIEKNRARTSTQSL